MQVCEQLSRDEPYATAPRSDWESFDPQLIGEALFATANIFSILKLIHFGSSRCCRRCCCCCCGVLKLVHFCTISSHLGPLQLTLGRMVSDVIRFLVLALLVCTVFRQLLPVQVIARIDSRVSEMTCSVLSSGTKGST